jgi:hypothetical protein
MVSGARPRPLPRARCGQMPGNCCSQLPPRSGGARWRVLRCRAGIAAMEAARCARDRERGRPCGACGPGIPAAPLTPARLRARLAQAASAICRRRPGRSAAPSGRAALCLLALWLLASCGGGSAQQSPPQQGGSPRASPAPQQQPPPRQSPSPLPSPSPAGAAPGGGSREAVPASPRIAGVPTVVWTPLLGSINSSLNSNAPEVRRRPPARPPAGGMRPGPSRQRPQPLRARCRQPMGAQPARRIAAGAEPRLLLQLATRARALPARLQIRYLSSAGQPCQVKDPLLQPGNLSNLLALNPLYTAVCPAGYRCSRLAYTSLRQQLLDVPGDLPPFVGVCAPCLYGEYCHVGVVEKDPRQLLDCGGLATLTTSSTVQLQKQSLLASVAACSAFQACPEGARPAAPYCTAPLPASPAPAAPASGWLRPAPLRRTAHLSTRPPALPRRQLLPRPQPGAAVPRGQLLP